MVRPCYFSVNFHFHVPMQRPKSLLPVFVHKPAKKPWYSDHFYSRPSTHLTWGPLHIAVVWTMVGHITDKKREEDESERKG
jgi:hypothetical protein